MVRRSERHRERSVRVLLNDGEDRVACIWPWLRMSPLRKGGLTIGFCLLQYHAKVEFGYPLGPLEGGVKVEPVAYSVM